ncbi:MAG: selenium cofactor biosynthesis protein YqeC [bacterium]
MDFAFLDPWSDFLPREGGHLIGISGSGGKTSLLKALAAHYGKDGVPVLLTCTTRTEPVDGVPAWALDEAPAPADLPPVAYLHGGPGTGGKWEGLAPGVVDDLLARHPDRIVIAEVDGSAKTPLKLYKPGEPRWPAATSLAVVMMGAQAVGSSAGGNLHRLGGEGVTPAILRDLPPFTVIEWTHLQTLLTGEDGYLARTPPGVPVVLGLAGLDQVADSIGLFEFAGFAMNSGVPLALFCSGGEEGYTFRTAYRTAWPDGGGPDAAG